MCNDTEAVPINFKSVLNAIKTLDCCIESITQQDIANMVVQSFDDFRQMEIGIEELSRYTNLRKLIERRHAIDGQITREALAIVSGERA